MSKYFILVLLLSPMFAAAQMVDFTDATMLLPGGKTSDHAIGVADMNGDGKDDIICMDLTEESPNSVEQTVYALIQGAGGTSFSSLPIGVISASGQSSADTWGMSVADIDRNGRNDFVGGGFYNGVYIFKSNTDNTSYSTDIELLDEIFVQGMSAFDINYDGHIDFFICDDNDISQMLLNDGNGNFAETPTDLTPVTDEFSDNSGNYGCCFSDVNNDGLADLYIAKCRQGVQESTDPLRINLLFMNEGDGNWVSEGDDRNLAIGAQSWCADFGDIDNDGDMDVFVGNHDVFSDLMENDGSGFFSEISTSSNIQSLVNFTPIQGSWADFNNDTYIDLIVTGQGNHVVALNNGDGTFTGHYDLFGNFPTNSYAIGDLNNDGFLDLYHSANGYGGWGNENFSDRLYLNEGNDLNWLKVNLTGVQSNINGIGARVSINGPWGVQIRDVKAGESYGIQNTMIQHFGLGTFDLIEELTVTWPSGVVDVYPNVDVNQQLELVEGQGVGIYEHANLAGLEVFPNPASDILTLNIEENDFTRAGVEFQLLDKLGRSVMQKTVSGTTERLDVSVLKAGSYTLNIYAGEQLVASEEVLINR